MIPLERMGEYTLGIERINIELSLRNKLALLDALENFLSASPLPLGRSEDSQNIPSAELLGDHALPHEIRRHLPRTISLFPSEAAAAVLDGQFASMMR